MLSFRNSSGPDEFPVGFYLHCMDSLYDGNNEKDKFDILSKKIIHKLSPTEYAIPEIVGEKFNLLEKISQKSSLQSGLTDGWVIEMSRGFDKANDADLLKEDSNGWPIFEGKNMHQYNHKWEKPEFTSNKRDGLDRESKRQVFAGRHVDVHNSCRLVFRNITNSTNMRTVISTIIPPHTFHTYALRSIVLVHNDNITLDSDYNKKISYLCGVLNSMTFDFAARARIQINLAPIIKSLPSPKPIHENYMAELAAKMVVGTPEFEGFAESLRIPNVKQTPAQRIEAAAEIDALVAHSYGLTLDEYKTVIESFPAFKKNPTLYESDEIVWDSKSLKEFNGEMAELALEYYENITGEQND